MLLILFLTFLLLSCCAEYCNHYGGDYMALLVLCLFVYGRRYYGYYDYYCYYYYYYYEHNKMMLTFSIQNVSRRQFQILNKYCVLPTT